MTNRQTLACWLAVGIAACWGCQSSRLGTIYRISRGHTTAEELFPERAGAPPADRGFAQTPPATQLGGVAPVTQTAFSRSDSVNPSGAGGAGSRSPIPNPTREQAFAAIAADLQRLSVENPRAEQELLSQLQSAEPRHWDLLVRRFNSTLAYNQQLVQPASADALYASQAAPPTSHTSAHSEPRVAHRSPQSPSQNATAAPAAHFFPPPYPATSHTEELLDSATPPPVAPRSTPPADVRAAPVASPAAASADPQTPPRVQSPVVDTAVRPATANLPIESTPPVVELPDQAAADEPIAPRPLSSNWQDSLDAAIADLESRVPAEPQSTSEAYDHARLRLLRLVADDLDGAVSPIPGLPPTEQDYWSKQMFAVAKMLDHSAQPEPKRRAAAAAMHLATAHADLGQIASLGVRNLTFCDEVFAYGAYKERSGRRFSPGEEVTLYVEIENFRSVKTDDGHHTMIGTSYQVLDSRGARVAGREFPAVDDYCLSRRRDFHIQYGVTLPERIYAGEYQLELTLTDQLGNKIGRASIDFEIVDPDE